MPTEKQKKIYQVAKELNVATPAIVEFLEDRGFDVPKKHMSGLSEEMYVEVIKKFDPTRWQRQLEEENRVHDDERRAEMDRARAEQSLKILDEITSQATTAAESLIRQVQEQKDERARKVQQQVDQVELEKLAEEKRLAEETERAQKAEEERLQREAEAQEAERKRVEEEERKKAEQEKRAREARERPGQPREQPRGERREGPPRRDEGLRPAGERRPRPTGDRQPPRPGGDRPPPRTGGDRQPPRPPREGEVRQPPRPPREGEERQPPRPMREGEVRRPPRPPDRNAPPPAPPKAPLKPKDPVRKRPTREDIEALEKQKKLLAQQKADKYRKSLIQPEPESAQRRKSRRKKVDQKEVEATIRQTLASIDAGKKRHRRRERDTEMVAEDDSKIRLTEFVTTQELANLMGVEVAEVITKFISMGKLVSINQRLEKDLIEVVADEFGFQAEFVEASEEESTEVSEIESAETMQPRPPVVTVMGHVDHGKTSLLDYLRKTTVIAGESGGITQHIGAYEVPYKNRVITFLDTPGHEAFTAMRARGAQVTDIVVLVVAADDQVRPQTVEAINHASSAGVPMVVAINKVDKPSADPERIRQQLAEKNILVEQWGGKIQSAEISAKFGQGIDTLLEEILLTADILELKANPDRRARGIVIESRLDKGRGILATVLVQAGTLKSGDNFVAGQQYGKVRTMLDEWGHPTESITPGKPVQVVGFSGAPQAGDSFVVFESEREVKEIAMRRQLLQREQTFRQIRTYSLDQFAERIKEGGVRELSLIIKGDADGSVEAICDTLQRLRTGEVAVRIVHKGVGAISESDVLLASATSSIILGFHVHPNIKAREMATREQVDIRVYRVIYEMEDDVRKALEGLLAPDTREDVIGLAEVRELFHIPKVGTILGSFVVSGKIIRSSNVRILRDGKEIWKGKISSLKRFKDDAKEVRQGFDCGIGLDGHIEAQVGDTLEAFEIVEIKRKLEQKSA